MSVLVRFECADRLVRECSDWEGPVPHRGDYVTITLPANTTPRAPGIYEPGIEATFLVKECRYIRQDRVTGAKHTILISVEPR